MAIQAQIYPDTSGFPLFITPEWAGGGDVGVHDETRFNPQRQQFHSQNPNPKNNLFPTHHGTPSISLSQIEKQSLEMDQFIFSQNERLRRVLREQRKQDATELLKKFETRTSFLLNRKDEEIAKAKTRSSQLESLLIKLQTDCLMWQQIAKQNELQAASLTNTILLIQQQQQHVAVLPSGDPLVEDTESCCDEQEQQSHNGLGNAKMMCRVCQRREVGVVVLPCRHLCTCGVCDPMIDLCPVCQTEKKGSVEALFC